MSSSTLKIVRATSKTYTVTVVDPDDDDTPIDLTGGVMYFTLKRNASDATALVAKASTSAAQILFLTQSGATKGQAEIYLLPADTEDLDSGFYWYDVWLVIAGKTYSVVNPDGPRRAEIVVGPSQTEV